LRLQLYRRLAEVRSEEDLAAIAVEFGDRFGPLPEEVENLFYQLRVKVLAGRGGAEGVTVENGQILVALPDSFGEADLPDLGADVRRSKRGLWLTRSGSPDWKLRLLDVLRALDVHAVRRSPGPERLVSAAASAGDAP
jgi:transcription-repair coupling factor (superfamily II helicase)